MLKPKSKKILKRIAWKALAIAASLLLSHLLGVPIRKP